MKVQTTALSIAMATALTMTYSLAACFADSEAGGYAQSQASTMNNSQEARETTTQAQSGRSTDASTHEQSEARTVNQSEQNREAGGPFNSNDRPPAGVPASTVKKQMGSNRGNVGSNRSATTRLSTVSHVPHMQTRSYRWSNTRRSRLASRSYATRTIQQAARTH